MNVRHLRMGVLAALLAFGVACGDDDSGSTSAGDTEADSRSEGDAPTEANYIAQADGICRNYDAKIEELTAEAEESAAAMDEADPAAAQKFLRELFGLSGQAVAEIRDLTLPEGDTGAEIDAALDELERALADADEQIATPEGAMEYFLAELQRLFGDAEDQATTPEGTTESAGNRTDPFAGIDERFAHRGFKVCFK